MATTQSKPAASKPASIKHRVRLVAGSDKKTPNGPRERKYVVFNPDTDEVYGEVQEIWATHSMNYKEDSRQLAGVTASGKKVEGQGTRARTAAAVKRAQIG